MWLSMGQIYLQHKSPDSPFLPQSQYLLLQKTFLNFFIDDSLSSHFFFHFLSRIPTIYMLELLDGYYSLIILNFLLNLYSVMSGRFMQPYLSILPLSFFFIVLIFINSYLSLNDLPYIAFFSYFIDTISSLLSGRILGLFFFF